MAAWLSAWLSGPVSAALNAIGRQSVLRLFGGKAIRGRKHFQIEGGAVSGAVVFAICVLGVPSAAYAAGRMALLLRFIIAVGFGAIVGVLMVCAELQDDEHDDTEGEP